MTEVGGESPPPVIRKNFTVIWSNGDDRTEYRYIIGSGVMQDNSKILVLLNDVETEFWINLDSVSSIHVTLEPGDE